LVPHHERGGAARRAAHHRVHVAVPVGPGPPRCLLLALPWRAARTGSVWAQPGCCRPSVPLILKTLRPLRMAL
jgi:hypothetical protein